MHDALLISLPFAQDPQNQPNAPVNPGTNSGPAPAAPQGGTQAPGGAQPNPQSPCADSGGLWIWMPLFLVLMYFLMIRPEQRRKKDAQQLLANLKAGDNVVTIGGMHGVVHQVQERTIVLRVDTVKVTIDKTAIARVVGDEPAQASAKPPAK